MALKQFQPKVKQLEQIKINFDENDADLVLPKIVNSKKKFEYGPTNNRLY